MRIRYDPRKNARNIAERGLSFERATDFAWETASIAEDDRKDYPERRFVAVGYLDSRLHVIVLYPHRGRNSGYRFSQGQRAREETI